MTDFDDLNNVNFIEPEITKKKVEANIADDNPIAEPKPKPKYIRPSRRKTPQPEPTTDDIFSDTPTDIKGREFHIMQNKITQYKVMFKKELKDFKVKKNPTLQDLEKCLSEMECIVSTHGVDAFITDSILQIIKMSETFTTATKFDINGCADALRENPKFLELCKMLYIKYKVFGEIPPEFQLIMCVGTTAYMCNLRNKQIQNY